jgi:S-methylmethionine-dependent homocysteine/selenocysteine methylase
VPVLPSLDSDRLFIGDGGLETVMIFSEGLDLPEFAAFPLLDDAEGRAALRRYYGSFLEVAHRFGVGFALDTPTWRASRDWGEKLGYSPADLADVNRAAVAFAEEIRAAEERPETPIAICGSIGPRGDAYNTAREMTPAQAEEYHGEQIATFADTSADIVGALTLPYAAEAIGIVRAAVASEIPAAISFTVETDGRLPSGQPLGEAIEEVDAETAGAAAYFMVNCAHPAHFGPSLRAGGAWLRRLAGARANASRKSHAELDEADDLDSGDPEEIGRLYGELKPDWPSARLLGGCCGTDARHVARICESWFDAA